MTSTRLSLHILTGCNSTDVTLSARRSKGHYEPSEDKDLDFSVVKSGAPKSGILNNSYIVYAECKSCVNNGKTELDFTSKDARFFYGAGPAGDYIASDSKNAGLRRHDFYGKFTMDMTQASKDNAPGVPLGDVLTQTTGAKETLEPHQDHDYSSAAHGLIMCACFAILFPFGVLILRVFEKVPWHQWNMILALVGTIIGIAVGIYASLLYNKVSVIDFCKLSIYLLC